MAGYRHLDVSEVGDVTVVRFRDRKIVEEIEIQEIGRELLDLVEVDGRQKLLLNFQAVEFLSSAALSQLIKLHKKIEGRGVLKLSNIRPDLFEVFKMTKLVRVFDIKDEEADALASF